MNDITKSRNSSLLNWLVLSSLFFLIISQLTFISIIITLFLFFYYLKQIKSSLSEIDIAFLIFFALSVISSLFARDKILALGSSLLFVIYYIFFSVGRTVEFDKNIFSKFLLATMLLLVIFGIFFFIHPNEKISIGFGDLKLILIPPSNDFEVYNSGIRSPSITPNPVIYSSVSLYFSMILILWGLSLRKQNKLKGYSVVGIIILIDIIALFTSNSRSLLLILPLVLILGLLLNRENITTISIVVSLLILGLILGVYLSTPSVFSRIRTAILGTDYTSFNVRADSYRRSIELFIKNPILGVGLMNFHLYAPYYFGPYVHNIYLSLLVETGILGTLAFFSIIFLLLKKFFPKNNLSWFKVGIISLIISFLLHGFVDNTMYVFSLGSLFWFFSGVLINQKI